jgi:hypothetical protein
LRATADAHIAIFLACLRNRIFNLEDGDGGSPGGGGGTGRLSVSRRSWRTIQQLLLALSCSKASPWEPHVAYIHVVAEVLVSPVIHDRVGLMRALLFHSASPRRPALLVAPAPGQPGCEVASIVGLLIHGLEVGQLTCSRVAITLQLFDWARKVAEVANQESMRA